MKKSSKNKGFTLIEVLIALVILAVGLLGVAALMMTSLQSNQGAFQRSQASLLAYDIVERMRANRAQATSSNSYALATTTTSVTAPSCEPCSPAQMAQIDISNWRAELGRSLPGATASITRSVAGSVSSYQISIFWEDAGNALTRTNGSTVTPSFSLRVDL